MKESKGYSLIELLVVVGIIATISSFVAGILVTTLRGSAKSKITNEVSRNGNYALSEISRVIVNSTEVKSVGSSTGCADTTVDPSVPYTGSSITVANEVGDETTFRCRSVSGNRILTKIEGGIEKVLIDQAQVKVDNSCSQVFKCYQDDQYSPPKVLVEFTLIQSTGTSLESIASADFSTSATLRNFKSF